jgi:hypothetical protein
MRKSPPVAMKKSSPVLVPIAPREAQSRLRGAPSGAGQISLSLLYLPYFAAVLAAERPSPSLVRTSDVMKERGLLPLQRRLPA